ncbi:MAG: hypothetical protein ORN98_05145, partial [Alphaproteobacteria bacterium]|nr:hypothetical protein [Alphaproteobacteria bacterium]
MKSKIPLIIVIIAVLSLSAAVGIIGYLWYRAVTSAPEISNTANTTTDEKNSRLSAEQSAAEEWKSAEKERERIAATNGLAQRIDEDNLVLKLTDGSEITLTNGTKCGHDGTELEITKCYGYFFGRHFEKVHG